MNKYLPASPNSRRHLKPWPDWAAGEYQTALNAARRLHVEAKVALERGLGSHRNLPLLQRLLPRQAGHARDAELAALRMEAERRREDEERWPRWAIQALREVMDLGGTAGWQAEMASQALKQKRWADVERLLNACLKAGQRMEWFLLYGPPPAGVSVVSDGDEEGSKNDPIASPADREE